MGHVPAGPLSQAGQSDDVPRRQHRGSRASRARDARRVGGFGERIAAVFLARRGAAILARNVRLGADEIDLVIGFRSERVAVEVKTRVGADPIDEFTADQADRLRRAAAKLHPPVARCDLVAVRIDAAGVDIRWLPYAS